MYEQKYLKYKAKYLELKAELEGSGWPSMPSMPSIFKKAPVTPEMQRLITKQKNVEEKIAILKNQISAQKRKDEADAVLNKAKANLDKTRAESEAAKEARRAAKAAISSSASSGGDWPKMPSFGATSNIRETDSDATKDLKRTLKIEEDKLILVKKEIVALQATEAASAKSEAAAKKQAELANKAEEARKVRRSSKESIDPTPASFY